MIHELGDFHLSHARCAQAYALAISSSPLRLLARDHDCAKSDVASSTSSRGRGPLSAGTRLVRACSVDLFIILKGYRLGP